MLSFPYVVNERGQCDKGFWNLHRASVADEIARGTLPGLAVGWQSMARCQHHGQLSSGCQHTLRVACRQDRPAVESVVSAGRARGVGAMSPVGLGVATYRVGGSFRLATVPICVAVLETPRRHGKWIRFNLRLWSGWRAATDSLRPTVWLSWAVEPRLADAAFRGDAPSPRSRARYSETDSGRRLAMVVPSQRKDIIDSSNGGYANPIQ
jgi:hypothetical protein